MFAAAAVPLIIILGELATVVEWTLGRKVFGSVPNSLLCCVGAPHQPRQVSLVLKGTR